MRRTPVTIMALLLGVSGVLTTFAAPASAAIENCRRDNIGPPSVGLTLRSCIYVDSSNGRATATILWGPGTPVRYVRPVVTIQRSGVSARNNTCFGDTVRPGTYGSTSCTAFLPNPAGSQAWRSDAVAVVGTPEDPEFVMPLSSELIVDPA